MDIKIRYDKVIILVIILCLFLLFFGCIPPELPDKTETQSYVPLTEGVQVVRGRILGGGDQTPQGLLDSPRTFIYKVQLDSGEEINITYTSYPPAPSSETNPGPQLTFYKGEISEGDYLVARGTYDAETHTLIVLLETDFIETFLEKP